MELFSVTCTTCHSKLKVRDRGAIGQILACPKCSAMVLVQPPAGWEAPATPVVAAVAPPSAPAPQLPAQKPVASNFEDAAALLDAPAAPVPSPPVQQAVAPPAVAEATVPSRAPLSRWLLIGGLAGTAVALIAAIGYALSGGDEEPVAIVAPDAPQDPATPTIVQPAPEDTGKSPPVEPADKKKPVEPAEPTDDPGEKPPVEDPGETKPVEPAPPMPKPQPLEIVDANPTDLAEKPKAVDTFNIDGSLQEFGALIEDKGFGNAPPAKPAGEAPPMPEGPAETTPVGPVSEEEPLPRPAPRKVDVARRLNDPLEGLEVNGLPLADFLQLLTDLTLVPITLDPAALPAIKASPETKVAVSLKGTKVGEALTAALAPHNLAYVATETQIVVLPAASLKVELREIKHDLGDLAKSEAEAKVLAEMIHACIAPASWDDAGGTASMNVEGTLLSVAQTPENHYGIVLLCEKLRLARKLPTRSTYPQQVLTLAPRASAADALLSAPVTVNFVPPTRIGRVGDYLKKAHGVRMLVDWRAVAEAGWTPEGEVKAGVAAQPLSVFLDRLAGRMDLAWRAIDAQTVELTTPAELERNADVEVLPVATEDAAALIAKLQKELGAERFAPGANFALRYDTAGQALVVRLPQPQVRKLQGILAKAAP